MVTDQSFKCWHICCALLLSVVAAQASVSYGHLQPCTTGREASCSERKAKERDVEVDIIEGEAIPLVSLLAHEEESRQLPDEPSASPSASPSSPWPVFLQHLLSDSPSESPTTPSPIFQSKENAPNQVDCRDDTQDDRECDHKEYDFERDATYEPTKAPGQDDTQGKENTTPSPAAPFTKECKGLTPCPHYEKPEETNATLEPTTTTFPSPSPSETPRPSSSQEPSLEPTIASKLGIELVPCAVDQDGVFGADRGQATTFDYLYEVEMNGLIGAGILGDVLEDTLDDGFAEVVASSLFPDECSGSATTTARTATEGLVRMLRRRRLAVSGISSRPVDIILEDLSCSETPSPGNNCFVVNGRATIYSTDGDNVSGTVKHAQEAAKLAMDDGAFNNVDNRIVSVTHRSGLEVGEVDDDSVGSAVDPANEDGSNESSDVPVYVWVVIAAAVVALVVGGFLLYKRTRRDEKRAKSARSALSDFSAGELEGASGQPKSPEPHYYNEETYQDLDSGNDDGYDPSMGENTKDAFAYSSGESGQNYQGAIRMHGGVRGAARSTNSSSTPSSGSRTGSVPQFRAPSDFNPDGDYPENREYHEPEILVEGENEDESPVAEVQVS